MISHKNCLALLKLSYCPFLGPSRLNYLEKKYENLNDLFFAKYNELLFINLKPDLISRFINWRKTFDAEVIMKELEKNSIDFISWHSPYYPALLKESVSPPAILFFRGYLEKPSTNKPSTVAIVGSRQNSQYSCAIIKHLIPTLVNHNIKIISGLALGVDSLAHIETIKNQGVTWAILGSGLKDNFIYPPENLKLAYHIIDSGGLLLSEFIPSQPAFKQNFPQRNRIISGLSQSVVVIEAGEKSGSLITAKYALEQGRDVLAVPGNIFSQQSIGTNHLIKDGATPLLHTNDILESLNIEPKESRLSPKSFKIKTYKPENNEELMIYNVIIKHYFKGENLNIDLINKLISLDTAQINSTLTILELKGIIKNSAGNIELNF